MNEEETCQRPVNWFELDRLVDGQLGDAEYRELLRQIDEDPDGWKQCALAFLQHQALQRELSELAGDDHPWSDVVPAEPAALVKPVLRHRRTWQDWVRMVNIAASVAVALFAGITVGQAMRQQEAAKWSPEPEVAIIDSGMRNIVANANSPASPANEAVESSLDASTYGFSPRRASSQYGKHRDDPVAEEPLLGAHCPDPRGDR